MKKYKITLLLAILFCMNMAQAQSTVADAVKVTSHIYKVYEGLPYITFDAKYTYFTDTAYSDFTREVTKGQYTFNGKKARYTMGDVEYLQNDSMLIAVYHQDQMMIISNPVFSNTAAYLPAREALDSLLSVYGEHYDFDVKDYNNSPTDTNTTGYIKMVRKKGDEVAQYDHFIIEFDLEQYVITRIEYQYTEKGQGVTEQDEPDPALRLLRNTDRKKTLEIQMFNYRFDHLSDTDYSESVFLWEEDGEYKPVEKYKDYKVYNARN